MNAKELIDYCEQKSSNTKNSNFKISGFGKDGIEFIIQSFPPEDKEIENWLLERLKAFSELRYLLGMASSGLSDPVLEQKIKYLRKAESLKNIRLVVIAGEKSYIQHNGIYFYLEEFDDYKNIIAEKIKILKEGIENKIDAAMLTLGELSQKYEDIILKIKEFKLEDND